MRLIKKLDIFILKAYMLLFAGTFFICLFIFMMQFMWRYVDELVGKGLPLETILKFFYYSGLTLVPMSMPLAVLLASLISFGNLGERFELLSMKAAGIPLTRILQPVFIFVILVCGGSFYFQNKVGPEATKQLATLVWSMKQKSPELDIPEGIFYNEIPGYNLFVERKDPKTGLLHGVMIYSNTEGYEDAQIVLADSGRLQSTADKKHLMLTLYNGERFKNMDRQSGGMLRANIPYMRESFIQEVDLIVFDANFNLMDANLFAGNAQAKNLAEIRVGIDSLRHETDSVGRSIYASAMRQYLNRSMKAGQEDSARIVQEVAETLPIDSLFANLSDEQKTNSWRKALEHADATKAEYEFRALITGDLNYTLRRHRIEAHKKFTMSLACMLFFFIGAPLGAIIRKGGLGVPVVISVIIFIFYYIVNVGSEKMAKTGDWTVVSGIWMSSMVLLPIGLFLINRANKDSVVFNVEGYISFLQKVLGLRQKRKLNRKEVVINDPRYDVIRQELTQLAEDCRQYAASQHLMRFPSYWRIFFQYQEDRVVMDIDRRLEALIEELHNSKDNVIIARLNSFPILVPNAHTRPFRNERWNMLTGIFLPLGVFFWLRIWRYRMRLYRDMKEICDLSAQIIQRINNNIINGHDKNAE